MFKYIEKTQRSINRHATSYVAGECARLGTSVAGARVGEEGKSGEALAGVYGGLLIFAALIIGAATLAPSGK